MIKRSLGVKVAQLIDIPGHLFSVFQVFLCSVEDDLDWVCWEGTMSPSFLNLIRAKMIKPTL